MKALIKKDFSQGFVLEDIKFDDNINEEEVIVKIKAASICGTDLHIYFSDDWAKSRIKVPRVIGHEGVGEIVALGKVAKQKSNLKVGDTVSIESHIPCLNCYQCKTGRQHICSNLKILGIDIDGVFAKYVKVPYYVLWRHSLGDIGAILEPLGNAFHTASLVDVFGKNVAIFGDGPIGIFLLKILSTSAPAKIFFIGANDYRINIAKKIVNNDNIYFIKFQELDLEFLKELTKEQMVDVVFEMSGSKEAILKGIEILNNGGVFVAFGITSHSKIEFNFNEIIFKAIKIIPINGRIMFDSWYRMTNLIESKIINPSDFITHKVSFDKYQEAFNLLINKEALKVILIINGGE